MGCQMVIPGIDSCRFSSRDIPDFGKCRTPLPILFTILSGTGMKILMGPHLLLPLDMLHHNNAI